MDPIIHNQAVKVLNEYELFTLDGKLYLSENAKGIELLFLSVIDLIIEYKELQSFLPNKEFVIPSSQFLAGNRYWVNHFRDIDNKKFFLSDVYDFLSLLIKNKIKFNA